MSRAALFRKHKAKVIIIVIILVGALGALAISDFIISFHGLNLAVWACFIMAAYLANMVLKKPRIKQPGLLRKTRKDQAA